MRGLGLEGDEPVRRYQMLEGFIMGAYVHDFAGAPHNLAVRRRRYRSFDVLIDVCEQRTSR